MGMLVAVEIGAVLSRYGDKLTDVSETGFDVKRLDSDDYTMYSQKRRGRNCRRSGHAVPHNQIRRGVHNQLWRGRRSYAGNEPCQDLRCGKRCALRF